MSIFPKRTVPGRGVTIHWNFNTSHLKDVHIFPFVRIGVRWPNNHITMLMEDYILGLPNPKEGDVKPNNEGVKYKYLKKSTPFTIFADYISHVIKRPALADILSGIESGRHYYLHFALPEDAPPGKYHLISEVYNNGKIRHSKTKEDDFFFVDQLMKIETIQDNNDFVTLIKNCSSEPSPVKIVECFDDSDKVTTKVMSQILPPLSTTEIITSSDKSFLLYNEEREVIDLQLNDNPYVIKNQQFISIEKDDTSYVMSNVNDDVFELHPEQAAMRNKADGITQRDKIQGNLDKDLYLELVNNQIIQERRFNS